MAEEACSPHGGQRMGGGEEEELDVSGLFLQGVH